MVSPPHRYLKYTQEQMMQAYPNVVFSQHEYVMRLQVMQEHSAELAAMVDHEVCLCCKITVRYLLQRSRATVPKRFHGTATHDGTHTHPYDEKTRVVKWSNLQIYMDSEEALVCAGGGGADLGI